MMNLKRYDLVFSLLMLLSAPGLFAQTACPAPDTVNYPLPGNYNLYTVQGTWGFATGHNGTGDQAVAEYYGNAQNYTEIHGMKLSFGYGTSAGPNSTITANIWRNNLFNNPGIVIHSEQLNIDNIIALNGDVNVMFSSPVSVNGEFYIGIDLDYNPGDTVAFWSNTAGDSPVATCWFRRSGGIWRRSDEPQAYSAVLSMSAHPIISGQEVTVTPSNPTINSGGSVQLNVNTLTPTVTYLWAPATGLSCTDCPNPQASPTTTTTYIVTTTDTLLNCVSLDTVIVDVTPVGVENDLFQTNMRVFPNPSQGQFMLDFSLTEILDLDISIFNAMGAIVFQKSLPGFSGGFREMIDLHGVAAGAYHVRISSGDRSYSQKILITK